MVADYGVREAVITGTQADVKWFTAPIRYAKEDGSDGVVRVSGANVNFHYIRIGPTQEALDISWSEINRQTDRHLAREGVRKEYYERKEASHAGTRGTSDRAAGNSISLRAYRRQNGSGDWLGTPRTGDAHVARRARGHAGNVARVGAAIRNGNGQDLRTRAE